jgi:hypothetical protein
MTTIYLDPSAVTHADAADRLAHLLDAGHALVLVTPVDLPPDGIPWSGRAAALPADPPRGSWFVTADATTCGDRRPNLRTLLIGPRASAPRPTRCDAVARDLRAAVLEILRHDAMS